MSNITQWRVLAVEDEPDGQEVIAGILGYFNIPTDVVSNAQEALQAAAVNNYTIMIIDLALPEMDGFELMQAIRANPRTARVPAVAVTAYHSSLVKQRAFEVGFDAYFSKPVDDTSFVRELDRVVSRR